MGERVLKKREFPEEVESSPEAEIRELFSGTVKEAPTLPLSLEKEAIIAPLSEKLFSLI